MNEGVGSQDWLNELVELAGGQEEVDRYGRLDQPVPVNQPVNNDPPWLGELVALVGGQEELDRLNLADTVAAQMPILERAVEGVPGGQLGLFGAVDTRSMRPDGIAPNYANATGQEALLAGGATVTGGMPDDEEILRQARASVSHLL